MLRSKPSLYNLPVVDLSPPQAKVINSQLTIILSKLPKALKKWKARIYLNLNFLLHVIIQLYGGFRDIKLLLT